MNPLNLLILLPVFFALSRQNEMQADFDKALTGQLHEMASKRSNLSMPRRKDTAIKLNSLYELQRAFITKRSISKRASFVGFTINSQYCPLNKSVSCDLSARFRSFDGSCNNADQVYGMNNMPYKRVLPPAYDDGTNSPRNLAYKSTNALPNVRSISLSISPPANTVIVSDGAKMSLKSLSVSNLFTHFGQFLTHDMTLLSTTTGTSLI